VSLPLLLDFSVLFCHSITPVQAQEVVWFSLDWKVPCVLYWISKDQKNLTEPLIQNPISSDVFGEDNCLARNGRKMITFTPLASEEMPSEGIQFTLLKMLR
jgi:PAB-dependent poly(A)-specific ribonuclease subunit 2